MPESFDLHLLLRLAQAFPNDMTVSFWWCVPVYLFFQALVPPKVRSLIIFFPVQLAKSWVAYHICGWCGLSWKRFWSACWCCKMESGCVRWKSTQDTGGGGVKFCNCAKVGTSCHVIWMPPCSSHFQNYDSFFFQISSESTTSLTHRNISTSRWQYSIYVRSISNWSGLTQHLSYSNLSYNLYINFYQPWKNELQHEPDLLPDTP